MYNIKKTILTLLITSIFVTFCGCGQTGALYLPQNESPAEIQNKENQNQTQNQNNIGQKAANNKNNSQLTTTNN